MRHGSLFSGIGGFDLAAEWMGWENVFHCEWNPFGQRVLHHYWPQAETFTDITKTDFTKYANTIDIISGGFPCQPFSLAGKRKGTDDERYLWGEMLRAIQEIKPRFVIAENVFGITNIDGGLVFQQVCLDLEAEGYEVQPFVIPACAKNAPHRRDRCWFIAQNPLFSRCLHGESNQERAEVRQFGDIGTRSADGIHISKRDATDTNGVGCRGRSEQSKSNQSKERKICENEQQHRDGVRCEIEGCSWDVTNSNGEGFQGRQNLNKREKYNTKRAGRSFEFRTENENINGKFRSNFENFPTQSPICGGDDGLPTELDGITFSKWRNESIKAYGNAIVPQVAYEIFKAITKTI